MQRPVAILFAFLLTFTLLPSAQAADPAFTLARVDPVVAYVSPGQVVTVRATLTNTGAVAETYALSLTGDRHYVFQLAATTVSLDPGASAVVAYDVTAAAAWYYGEFQLRVAASTAPSVFRNLVSAVETPVTLTLAMNDTRLSPTGQSVTGRVTAAHLDGSPFAGAVATVSAEGSLPMGLVRVPGSSTTVTTGADGVAYFNLGQSPVDRTPGRHFVSAIAPRPGASAAESNEAFYNILT